MSRKQRQHDAEMARIRKRLSHYAQITYTLDGAPHKSNVEWYGYPQGWNRLSPEQKIEWWRQHCVRQFAMPLHGQLTGVTIKCEGTGL